MTARTAVCWAVVCERVDTRPYLSGPACPEHTPARLAGRPEPGRTAYRLEPLWQTPAAVASAAEACDKSKPGGYVSKFQARRAAMARMPSDVR